MISSKTPTTTTDFISQTKDTIRLNKFLAERIGISRRQADELIASGQVLVNQRPAQIGQPIDKKDKVCYNGRDIPFLANFTYLALNKPAGYVSSRRQQGANPTLYDLLPDKYHCLKTVGRLDQDTSGLILLTNDGDFSFQMTHPSFYKEKRYYLQLDRPLAHLHQQMIADLGVNLPDGKSQLGLERLDDILLLESLVDDRIPTPSSARRSEVIQDLETLLATSPRLFWQVTMHEGRNRQIRRTFAALGYTVLRLHRVQFGPYLIDGLATGTYIEVSRH